MPSYDALRRVAAFCEMNDSRDEMGVSVWYFLRPRPGELQPIPRAAVEAFFFGKGRLPCDDKGLVRLVEVLVHLQDRKAVAATRIAFPQYRALPDGTVDREHHHEIMALTGEVAFGGLALFESPPGVVKAEHRFAKRRLEHLSRWTPTAAERTALRDLVNCKAGHEVM